MPSGSASWVGVVERVVSTFLQAFIAALLATSPGAVESHVDWGNSFWIGIFAAATSLLTSLMTLIQSLKEKIFDKPGLDLVYRAVVTFGQTLIGLAVAAGAVSALTFDWDTALKASVIAAGTALLKGLIGINAKTFGASTFDRIP
jgi:hypothetical protein